MEEVVHHCRHCGASDVEDMGLIEGEDLFCFRCHGRGPSEEFYVECLSLFLKRLSSIMNG